MQGRHIVKPARICPNDTGGDYLSLSRTPEMDTKEDWLDD